MLLAAILANFLGLTTSIFIMVVYDRVLPNEATESLIALTIGVGIALLFDFLIKNLRAGFIDRAGQRADMAMGRRIFDQLLDMQMRARKGLHRRARQHPARVRDAARFLHLRHARGGGRSALHPAFHRGDLADRRVRSHLCRPSPCRWC